MLGELFFYVSWLGTWLILISPYLILARDRTEKQPSKDIKLRQQFDIIEQQKKIQNATFTALVFAHMEITRLEGELDNG